MLSLVLDGEEFVSLDHVTSPLLGARVRHNVEYEVAGLPPRWSILRESVWTQYFPPECSLRDQGWKIHVSTSDRNAQNILNIVSEIACYRGVPFKHLSSVGALLYTHHKHAAREQSGKFIALYPHTDRDSGSLARELSEALEGYEGPDVLTDIQVGDSCVYARYGSFRKRDRILRDGTVEQILQNPSGSWEQDIRLPGYVKPPWAPDLVLPEGNAGTFNSSDHESVDPFADLTLEQAVVFSNSGGVYRGFLGKSNPVEVIVKEARADTGLDFQLRTSRDRLWAEWVSLSEIYGLLPGICPKPLRHFTAWQNSFLVIEFIGGRSLPDWVMDNYPLIRPDASAGEFDGYAERCAWLAGQLEDQIRQLHEVGWAYGDVAPQNIIVGEHDAPRLIDFECAVRLNGASSATFGTEMFLPRRNSIGTPEGDLESLGILHEHLLYPDVVSPAHSGVARHRRIQVIGKSDRSQVEITARRDTDSGDGREPEAHSPTAAQLIGALAQRLTVFPPPVCPDSLASNGQGFYYGALGMAYALQLASPSCDSSRFGASALASALSAPLNDSLACGRLGIVPLAILRKDVDLAARIVRDVFGAGRLRDPSLDFGLAGLLSMACLVLACDPTASGLEAIAETLTSRIQTDYQDWSGPAGLSEGWSGIAVALLAYMRLAQAGRSADVVQPLINRDLRRRVANDTDGFGFPHGDIVVPYLDYGSAGVGMACLAAVDVGADFDTDIHHLLVDTSIQYCAQSGVYSGGAGLELFRQAARERGIESQRIPLSDGHMIRGRHGPVVLDARGYRVNYSLMMGSSGVALMRGLGTRAFPWMYPAFSYGAPAAIGEPS